ncbi:MAG: oxidoreductase, partial [Chthoniobacteraceae bacterium]
MSAKPIQSNAPSTEALKAAVELLERVAADRALIAALSEEDRTRLVQAAGEVFCPDLKERRRLVKAKTRQRKNEQLARDQSRLSETGIRKLR